MSDRRRERRGRHESMAGAPAEETLQDLVRQFSDRYAFIRELIQNSLDAAASTIDVEMRFEDGTLEVAVVDDGEGMDRDTIEGYLLTLFRSTKEQDLTKIGKFGIGFVSLFAMGPREVVVDTGRDGIWHRVIFHEDRSYTLMRMEDPFEGTTVTLKIECSQAIAARDCKRVRESAERWCRYAEADISTSAEGVKPSWSLEPIAAPFEIEGAVSVSEEADGFHAVMSISSQPIVGFYNHGLTLWEAQEPLIPGVSFRVKGRHLEHTLTRDNVIRDRHFRGVMKRLSALAEGRLGDAVHAALIQAAAADDAERLGALFGDLSHEVAWRWDEAAPIFSAVGRGPMSLGELRAQLSGGLLRWAGLGEEKELLWSTAGDPIGQALAAAGRPVLRASGPHDLMLSRVERWLGVLPAAAHLRYRMLQAPERTPAGWPALAKATAAAGQAVGERYELLLARFHGEGEDALARPAPKEPWAPTSIDERVIGRSLAINLDHPLLQKLLELPPTLGGPLLLRAARLSLGIREPLKEALLGLARDAALEDAP
ncbi:MAG: ATP-binding protein [Alphaproteobacteria bacterium]|nr:ATP-binding protein [Alphaproteobacteria bacterium]